MICDWIAQDMFVKGSFKELVQSGEMLAGSEKAPDVVGRCKLSGVSWCPSVESSSNQGTRDRWVVRRMWRSGS